VANQPISMSKIRHILRMHSHGRSKRLINERTGVARNTLRKYLRIFDESGLEYESVKDLSDSELETLFNVDTGAEKRESPVLEALYAYFPKVEKQLSKEGVTRQLLWEEYKTLHPDGVGRTCFCTRFAKWLGRVNPSMRIVHKNGDKMFVDFTGHRLEIVDEGTGQVQPVEVFVAILGGSQMTYVEAVASQKKEDFIGACERAFLFYGGVTKAIVPDNLKSAVTRGNKFEAILNDTFADFADHYGTTGLPARPHEPKDKSLVEGAVKISYLRIFAKLRRNVYYTLEALNKDILEALEEHNRKHFQGRKYSRKDRFEGSERATLMALPVHPYELRKQLYATVAKNYYVCLPADAHYYSAPYRLIGKKVTVRYSSTRVSLYYRGECVAEHDRSFVKHDYTINEDHRPPAHQYLSERTPEKLLAKASLIHDDVRLYIMGLLGRAPHHELGEKSSAGILEACKRYGAERTAKACKRAMHFNMYSYQTIVLILDKGLENASLSDDSDLAAMPEHENIRGGSYYS